MDGPESNPMQSSTISRNYAETLLALARKANDPAGWGAMFRQVADAMDTDKSLRLFLESPRIGIEVKTKLLSRALGDRVPLLFLRFVQQLIRNRRQSMIPAISSEYTTLLDAAEGRAYARVTLSREVTEDEKVAIQAKLSDKLGIRILPHIVVDPSILGGVIVRMGDTVMDGSVSRKLELLRRLMVAKPSYSDA